MTYSDIHVDIKFDTEQIEKEAEKFRKALEEINRRRRDRREEHIIRGEN